MTDKPWKRFERVCAKRLGGVRAGPTGRNGPDVLHDHLAIQCKERKSLPGWLIDAMSQAVRDAKDGQLPLAILHVAGGRHDDDLVVVRLADWEAWYGAIEPPMS